MSILKNFVNPWESGGVLDSDVTSNRVLEDNVLSHSSYLSGISQKQEKKFTGYLFDDTNSLYPQLGTTRKQIENIFRKNGITIYVKIISRNKAKQLKDKLGDYDVIVGIAALGSGYSIGFSEPLVRTGDYKTDEFSIYNKAENTVQSYVNKSKVTDSGGTNIFFHSYRAAYYTAHEFLHQALIKAFAKLYGRKAKDVFDISFYYKGKREIRLVPDNFKIHEDDIPNLNTTGSKLNEKFKIVLPSRGSSKMRPEERILPKHHSLLHYWLNPNVYKDNTGPFLWQYKENYLNLD